MKWLRKSLALLLVLTMALLAGCSAKPATSEGQSGQSEGAGDGQSQETITLKVWDTNPSGSLKEVMDQLAREFEASHPGVKVEHKGFPTEELQKTLQRVAGSGEGPDVVALNQGESSMGPMVRAGLVLPMDPYAEKYKWTDRMSSALLQRNRYSEDGKTFGTGTLWGASQVGEIVGFFYNKELFAQAGVQVPGSFAELEQAMDALKAKGITPIVFGNLDKWPGIHLYGEVLAPLVSREYVDGLIYRQGQQSWESPEVVAAAAKLRDWVQKGYLTENYEGIGYDDSWKLFAAGQGAMFVTGTWLAGDLAAAMGDKVGFFLVPAGENGKEPAHVGGVGLPYAILKSSQHPDLAAELIDWLVSDRATELLLQSNNLPAVRIPDDRITAGTVSGDVYAAWNHAVEANAFGHYLDWATPTFYDTLTAALQELMAGRVTPEQFAKELQNDYAAFLAEQG